MAKLNNLTGRTFGRLTVASIVPNTHRPIKWYCRCSCGNTSTPSSQALTSGITKSCGCMQAEALGNRFRTHGMHASRTYASWESMNQRCNNPKNPNYIRYGGRGIKILWDSFESFFADMGERPKQCSIDRINNDGHYSADNCRWATTKQQANNTSRTRAITYRGRTLSIKDWSDVLHIRYGTLLYRLRVGWPVEKAFGVKK